jgi:hypothetical protein
MSLQTRREREVLGQSRKGHYFLGLGPLGARTTDLSHIRVGVLRSITNSHSRLTLTLPLRASRSDCRPSFVPSPSRTHSPCQPSPRPGRTCDRKCASHVCFLIRATPFGECGLGTLVGRSMRESSGSSRGRVAMNLGLIGGGVMWA